jgi:hypothetical protein
MSDGGRDPIRTGISQFCRPALYQIELRAHVRHSTICSLLAKMNTLDPATTPEEKFANFQKALRSVLRVSKKDLDQALAADKIAREGKPKRGPKPRHSSALPQRSPKTGH